MVDHLNSFASEVTKVAHEVGTEGKLGAQAQVTGVGGTWKILTQNVNTVRNCIFLSILVVNDCNSQKIICPADGDESHYTSSIYSRRYNGNFEGRFNEEGDFKRQSLTLVYPIAFLIHIRLLFPCW